MGTARTRRASGAPSRAAQLDLLATLGPDGIVHEFGRLGRTEAPAQPLLPHLVMPARSAGGPSLEVFIAGERNASASLGGRSVFGWETDSGKARSG